MAGRAQTELGGLGRCRLPCAAPGAGRAAAPRGQDSGPAQQERCPVCARPGRHVALSRARRDPAPRAGAGDGQIRVRTPAPGVGVPRWGLRASPRPESESGRPAGRYTSVNGKETPPLSPESPESSSFCRALARNGSSFVPDGASLPAVRAPSAGPGGGWSLGAEESWELSMSRGGPSGSRGYGVMGVTAAPGAP